MKLLKFLVFLNLIYSCFCAAIPTEFALTLTEIDVGTKSCSMALARSGQYVDTLRPIDFAATFFLTDGEKEFLLPDKWDFSWKPLKGQTREELFESECRFSHLCIIPTINDDMRKALGMNEKDELFFECRVSVAKNILNIYPGVTMIHRYKKLELRKTIKPMALFSTYSMIPRMMVTIV